jgi:hypothetical protein
MVMGIGVGKNRHCHIARPVDVIANKGGLQRKRDAVNQTYPQCYWKFSL